MQPTRVQSMTSPMRFKNSDLRSKCTTGTVYIHEYMVPLLPVCVLGMPLILLVCVVGILVMSQNTSTWILGLTDTNYSSPRVSPSRYGSSYKPLPIQSYHTNSPIITSPPFQNTHVPEYDIPSHSEPSPEST